MQDELKALLVKNPSLGGDYYGSQLLPQFAFKWEGCPMTIKGRRMSCDIHNSAAISSLSLMNQGGPCRELCVEWEATMAHYDPQFWHSTKVRSSKRLTMMAQSVALSMVQAVAFDLNVDYDHAMYLMRVARPVYTIGPQWLADGLRHGYDYEDWLYVDRYGLDSNEYSLTRSIKSLNHMRVLDTDELEALRQGLSRVLISKPFDKVAMYQRMTDDQIRRFNRFTSSNSWDSYYVTTRFKMEDFLDDIEGHLTELETMFPRLRAGSGVKPQSFILSFDKHQHKVTFDKNGDLICLAHKTTASCAPKLAQFAKTLHPLKGRITDNKAAVAKFLAEYVSSVVNEAIDMDKLQWDASYRSVTQPPIKLGDIDKCADFVGSTFSFSDALFLIRHGITRDEAEHWAREGLKDMRTVVAHACEKLAPEIPDVRIAHAVNSAWEELLTLINEATRDSKIDLARLVDVALTCVEHGREHKMVSAFAEKGLQGVEDLALRPPEDRVSLSAMKPTYLYYDRDHFTRGLSELAMPLNWWQLDDLQKNHAGEILVLQNQLKSLQKKATELRSALETVEGNQAEVEAKLEQLKKASEVAPVQAALF